MQQPPLSQQIKSLEQQLGVQLFRRKARGVELTDAGQTFFDDARGVLSQLERAIESTRRTARGEQGRICVGLTPTAPFHPLVTQVIREFRENYPKVMLTLEESLSQVLVDRIRDEQIDVALVRNSVVDTAGLTVTELVEEPMLVALPARHRLATGPEDQALAMKSLIDEVFVLYGPPGSGIYDSILTACQRAGFTPRLGQTAPQITSTLGLVAAGLGVSLVPASMRRISMDGIAYRRLKGAQQPRTVLNLISRHGDPSAAVRHFVRIVRMRTETTSGRAER
jgi:DNA-binding transcriptional LysR family regulator